MKHLRLFENFDLNEGVLESALNEGTDAIVAMKTKDGKIIATKVQSDGYPHHMIPNLNKITNYLDVEDMIKGGEMAIIEDGKPEYYQKRNPKASFKMDITEDDDENYAVGRVDNELNGSYFYYFTQEDGWRVQNVGNQKAELKRFITPEDAEKRKFELPR